MGFNLFEMFKGNAAEPVTVTYYKEECEYKRYIIGAFKSDAYVNKMLKEYSELCIDSPRLTEFVKAGKWTVIPCPVELIGRGDFYNLMNWLSQEGEEASALALHDEAGYYAVTDKENSAGDTVIVHFENGGILRWNLPEGTGDDHAYSVIRKSENNGDSIKDFLSSIGAEELIKHFDTSSFATQQ